MHRGRIHLQIVAALLLAAGTSRAQSTGARDVSHVITGVTVIDVVSGRRVLDQSVVVTNNRIVAMGAASQVRTPADARTIDGRGRFLIPGLWDMHVHLFRNRMDAPGMNTNDSDVFFPAFIANGVTGVRDMSTDLDDHAQIQRWARGLHARRLVAPRIQGGSPLLDGVPVIQPNAVGIATAVDAARIADSLITGGVKYLKVYSNLSREAYFAIAAQAKKRGIPFAGHVPTAVTQKEASDAGQLSFEHMINAPSCAVVASRALDDEIARIARDSAISRDSAAVLQRTATLSFYGRFDIRECTPLFERFVRNRTWQVPTLTILHSSAFADSAWRADPRLKYISPQLMAEWRKTRPNFERNNMNPAQRPVAAGRYRIRQKILAAMDAAGVGILAGTDVHNPWIYPGFSMHDELSYMVEAGLTPLSALRAATLNPARYFNATDSLGAVAPGKVADLVLLDADPLTEISNTRRIRGVFLNGRYFDRAALDRLLGIAEAAARRPSKQ